MSPVFHYWVPANNILGIPVPTDPGRVGIPGTVADGVYLMLEPLSKGDHSIHFEASFGTGPGVYAFDVSYTVTVK